MWIRCWKTAPKKLLMTCLTANLNFSVNILWKWQAQQNTDGSLDQGRNSPRKLIQIENTCNTVYYQYVRSNRKSKYKKVFLKSFIGSMDQSTRLLFGSWSWNWRKRMLSRELVTSFYAVYQVWEPWYSIILIVVRLLMVHLPSIWLHIPVLREWGHQFWIARCEK